VKEKDLLKGTEIDGRIILKCIFKKWDVDWINPAQDCDKLYVLLNVVVNLCVL
jgi:hypothetical protein